MFITCTIFWLLKVQNLFYKHNLTCLRNARIHERLQRWGRGAKKSWGKFCFEVHSLNVVMPVGLTSFFCKLGWGGGSYPLATYSCILGKGSERTHCRDVQRTSPLTGPAHIHIPYSFIRAFS